MRTMKLISELFSIVFRNSYTKQPKYNCIGYDIYMRMS